MTLISWLALPLVVGFVKGRTDVVPDVKDREGGYSGIRCPACHWQPEKHSRWLCEPGCGHSWNTFDTRGLCPGCAKKWFHTACLECATWSAHEAWYVTDESRSGR